MVSPRPNYFIFIDYLNKGGRGGSEPPELPLVPPLPLILQFYSTYNNHTFICALWLVEVLAEFPATTVLFEHGIKSLISGCIVGFARNGPVCVKEERAGNLIAMYSWRYGCYCSFSLPHGAVGWSSVCDCGISGSYSLYQISPCSRVS